MTNEELEYTVRSNDRELDRLRGKIEGVNGALAKGTVKSSRLASQQVQSMGRTMGRVGLVMAAALGGAAVASLKVAGDFEQSLNVMQAVSGATAEQMKAVRGEAVKLGADIRLPATSAKDAAVAMTELAKGGLSVKDSMAAARGTIQLAVAASVEEGEAATIAARALNAFGLKGRDATRVADLLAAAANASTGEITDFADGFRQASSQAARMKVPIQDMTTALALMANKGVEGATAGVSLKVMLTRLAPTTDKAKQAMRKLGLITKDAGNRLFDAKGEFVGIRRASELFRGAMKGLTTEQKIQRLQTIFGMDAQRAANIVLLGGGKAWKKMKKNVTEEGAAAKIAAAKNKGLNGAIDAFKSAAETAGIALGTILLPAATSFVKSFLIPAAQWIEKNKTLTLILVGVLAGFAGVLMTVSAALKFYALVQGIAAVFTTATNAALIAQKVLMATSIVGAIILVAIALVMLWKKSERFRAIVTGVWNAVKGATLAFVGFFRTKVPAAFNAVLNWLRGNWPKIAAIISGPFFPIVALATDAFGIRSKLVSAFRGILARIKEWGGDVKSFLTSLPGRVAEAARGIGTAIKDGILGGLGGLKTALTNAIKDAATGALDGVKSFLHIKSPSLVFAVEIGQPIAEGVAQGIRSNAPLIRGALQDAIGSAMKGQAGFERFSSVAQQLFGAKQQMGELRGNLRAARGTGDPEAIAAAQQAIQDFRKQFKLDFKQFLQQQTFDAALERLRRFLAGKHSRKDERRAIREFSRRFKLGSIPGLATGAVINSPTLALLGETRRAQPEIVTPDRLMRRIVRDELARGGRDRGGGPLVSIEKLVVREEADVDRIAARLAALLA